MDPEVRIVDPSSVYFNYKKMRLNLEARERRLTPDVALETEEEVKREERSE